MLSVRMTESRDERKILVLASTSIPSLVACRVNGAFLEGVGWSITSGPLEEPLARADVEGQFAVINGAGGAISIPGVSWGWAFPLRSLAGTLGHLVVGSDVAPSASDEFVLRTLAQQVGIAIANARLHHRQLAASTELRAANARLADSLAEIRRRAAIHERLTRASMTGTGLTGVVDAIHELTGHPILVEDRKGHVIANAGADLVTKHVGRSVASHEETIRRAAAAVGPTRERDRIVVIVNPSDGPVGILSLIDPEGTAGESEIVALEHGATIVGMELSRLRRAGETELRIGRDLLEDLLAGADPHNASDRASALGCDLLEPRRIAVVMSGPTSSADDDRLMAAVQLAMRDHPKRWFVTARGGAVVILADAETDWRAVQAHVERAIDAGCWIGVGGPTTGAVDVPRSHREARLALKMADAPRNTPSVTAFDDLGVFRIFAEVEDPATVERFAKTWLGTLLEYDERKPAELVETLSQFLDLGSAHAATCAVLGIHRSTLKYRLHRIREISGHDLSDPDTRFNLQLATRAWRTLDAMRGSEPHRLSRPVDQGAPASER
jgi:hypothetical protein